MGDESVLWHQVGHLQRNKARRTVPLVSMLHSGDSLRLLETLDQLSAELGRRLPVLLEVNISGEAAKHGFAADEMAPVLEEVGALEHLQIRGLMAMAGLGQGAEDTRRDFAQLRQLRDRLKAACPPNVSLDELSMGMSGDFEAAIEEGSTIVRVGSALFEGVAHG
jgi:pyridoxal phosphate enzyme (YggS family)